jgi:predicted nucleic acid-binding protein
MMRFYIDTCIWIDFIEDREGFNDEPIGEYAHKLLAHLRRCKYVIIINDFLFEELNAYYDENEIMTLLSFFKTKNCSISLKQKEEAEELSDNISIPYGDALHAVLARDNGTVLVTRDKHFRKIEWLTTRTPEEIIS